MTKIARVSKILQIILWGFFFALPVLVGTGWVFFEELHEMGMMERIYSVRVSGLPIVIPLSMLSRGMGFLVTMIPVAIDMIVIRYLIRLFSLYARGEIFTADNVRYIRRVGIYMLVGQALSPVFQSLLTIALTLSNPPGQRMISIGLYGSNFSEIVTAVMIIVVAWIMDEGRKLSEEQSLVI